MGRYSGPRVKKMRALGVDLPGLSRKSIARRPYPPGQHGNAHRGHKSDFKRQLMEKQKLRYNYGVGERQFRLLFKEARNSQAATGKKLLQLLECRLDNVVFRAGLAPTIPAARQLVAHRHFTVNGKRVDIASFRVREGDVIAPRPKSKDLDCIVHSLEEPALARPDWVSVDTEARTATVSEIPDHSSVPFEIDVHLVVEYYATRI